MKISHLIEVPARTKSSIIMFHSENKPKCLLGRIFTMFSKSSNISYIIFLNAPRPVDLILNRSVFPLSKLSLSLRNKKRSVMELCDKYQISPSVGTVNAEVGRQCLLMYLFDNKTLGVVPLEPNKVMQTLASVPAPRTSPVSTETSYTAELHWK